MMYLLDTNIVINFLRGDDATVKKINLVLEEGLAMSTVSLAELYHGAEKSNNPQENTLKIEKFAFIPEVTVFHVDVEISRRYGKLMSALEKKGVKLAGMDVLIAATAQTMDCTLLTSDKKHFTRLDNFGVKVEAI